MKAGQDDFLRQLTGPKFLLMLFVAFAAGSFAAIAMGPGVQGNAAGGTAAAHKAALPDGVVVHGEAVKDPLEGKHTAEMDKAPVSPMVPRLEVFPILLKYIQEAGIKGDYVETGVFTGGSASAVAKQLVCTKSTPAMKMWLYDSWEGMPETRPEDGAEAKKYVKWGKDATMEGVKAWLIEVGMNVDQGVVWRKGYFNETFPLEKPDTVAFLHIDSDWYDSVYDSLATFYDRVAIGGVVLYDFGYWEGARRAFYDFVTRRGEHPLIERNHNSQAWFVKGREHARVGRTALNDPEANPASNTC